VLLLNIYFRGGEVMGILNWFSKKFGFNAYGKLLKNFETTYIQSNEKMTKGVFMYDCLYDSLLRLQNFIFNKKAKKSGLACPDSLICDSLSTTIKAFKVVSAPPYCVENTIEYIILRPYYVYFIDFFNSIKEVSHIFDYVIGPPLSFGKLVSQVLLRDERKGIKKIPSIIDKIAEFSEKIPKIEVDTLNQLGGCSEFAQLLYAQIDGYLKNLKEIFEILKEICEILKEDNYVFQKGKDYSKLSKKYSTLMDKLQDNRILLQNVIGLPTLFQKAIIKNEIEQKQHDTKIIEAIQEILNDIVEKNLQLQNELLKNNGTITEEMKFSSRYELSEKLLTRFFRLLCEKKGKSRMFYEYSFRVGKRLLASYNKFKKTRDKIRKPKKIQ
jgi:hypothetical protein